MCKVKDFIILLCVICVFLCTPAELSNDFVTIVRLESQKVAAAFVFEDNKLISLNGHVKDTVTDASYKATSCSCCWYCVSNKFII